jgi:hypothetical protein
MLEDSFKLRGPHGIHNVFVFPPLGLSLRAFQDMMPDGILDQPIVVIALQRTLVALDFLNGVANLTHTGKGATIKLYFSNRILTNLKFKMFMLVISSLVSQMKKFL